ncbi:MULTISPECIES: hypothetical protein [Microbacterium]|nr:MULTISPECIES: hypothetical protein [Microbacterium]
MSTSHGVVCRTGWVLQLASLAALISLAAETVPVAAPEARPVVAANEA